MVTIPAKYKITSENEIQSGSLGLKCKYCGTEFAIPPADITEELANADCCEDPGCIEKANAEAEVQAAIDANQEKSADAANTIATALGR